MRQSRSFISEGALLSLVFVLSILCMAGCGIKTEPDKSLLTGDPCSPPCWHNIVPGVSTEDDVRRELEGNLVKRGLLRYRATEQNGVPLDVFTWEVSGKKINGIYLQKGQVLKMMINVTYALTLGEIVEKYGPPEGIYARLGGPEYWNYLILFYYSSQGFSVTSYTSKVNPDQYRVRQGIGILSKDMQVDEVAYFAPTSLGSMVRDVFLLDGDSADRHLANVSEWQGFGEVKLAD